MGEVSIHISDVGSTCATGMVQLFQDLFITMYELTKGLTGWVISSSSTTLVPVPSKRLQSLAGFQNYSLN